MSVGDLKPSGARSAASTFRSAASLARGGQRIATPTLPGDAGAMTGAIAKLAAADDGVSDAVADAATRLADRLDAVVDATVAADRAGFGYR